VPERAPVSEGFAVTPWVHWLGREIHRHPRRWIRLGNLETRTVADRIAGVEVRAPVYVAGLARSGSTILLEKLARHPDVATHRYRDDPPVFIPYWWNRWLERIPQKNPPARERSHRDGIAVTPDSPEAFEEALWMAFFPHLHDPARSAVLGRDTVAPGFEAFYRDHLRKLLAVRGGRRYLAKGNYNLTRLAYLQRLFPDARFVIPVRDPVWHVASLMKQHRLFLDGQRDNPRARAHLRRIGHFEFGADRRPINPGDTAAVEEIQALWARGDELAGWARYWALLHRFLADQLDADPALRAACLIVRHEALCAAPAATLAEVLRHCDLAAAPAWIEASTADVRAPGYYAPQFTPTELDLIAAETAAAAARLGYGGTQRTRPAWPDSRLSR
jgi:hypothetical protein